MAAKSKKEVVVPIALEASAVAVLPEVVEEKKAVKPVMTAKDKKRLDSFSTLKSSLVSSINSSLKYSVVQDDVKQCLSNPRWSVSTGVTLIDYAFGGGIFEGKIARLYGPPAASKSSLLDLIMLQCMANDIICVRQDPEGAFSEDRVKQLAKAPGLVWKPELFIPSEPKTLNDLFEVVHTTLHKINPVSAKYTTRPVLKYKIAFLVDTISDAPTAGEYAQAAGTSTKKGIAKGTGEGMAARARVMRAEMRKMSLPLALHGATMVVLEQSMKKIGTYGGGFTTGGGDGLDFQCSQSALMQPSSAFQDGKGEEAGMLVRFSTDKVRRTKPRAKLILPFYYEHGFNNLESIILLLETHGVIKKGDKTLTVTNPNTGVSATFKRSVVEHFEADPELTTHILECAAHYKDLIWYRKKISEMALADIDEDDVDDEDSGEE